MDSAFTPSQSPHSISHLTNFTNHTIDVAFEKFNFTIPFPGPHKPHRIVSKLTANKQNLYLFDLVGLNGAIHAIDRILDPRGRHQEHPKSSYDFMDEECLWDVWEEWLPQLAASVQGTLTFMCRFCSLVLWCICKSPKPQ